MKLCAANSANSCGLVLLTVELDAEQFAMTVPDHCDAELAELVSVLSCYARRRTLALDVDTAGIFVEDDFHVMPSRLIS